ncbi:MAG: 1-deoxy-D-xylulose-5-phosphate synthase [Clostridiales bacterium]|nr:1-deoxy-D-xylulose-5-phosphate synthase [Clostridiales bacterium]
MSEHAMLDRIQTPADLKKLSAAEIKTLCAEIRDTLIETVSCNGGHLSSNLGVVELTVALHLIFDAPRDQIVWDVGHQCYVHKLLTGRAEQFHTLRTEGGVSGFPRPAESEYDTFIVGHSSTAVSAANGLAKAKKLTGDKGYVIAVMGDGAMTGGIAYEGLSNAGRSEDRLIVILNDNRMSINRNVGFVARHLAILRSRPRYVRVKNGFGAFVSHIPLVGKPLYSLLLEIKTKLKNALYKNSPIFEDMGFYYLGPVNGHSLSDLTRALRAAKNIERPVLLHVETVKGKGYGFAEQSPDTYHGVSGFDRETGETPSGGDSFSSVFGDTLCQLASEDRHICAITAAMQNGTGLGSFARRFPDRFFDVGIAEQHAVTFASGLSCNGMLPVFAVYSTFLQRSYDQILNDTAILGQHIVLAIDRAGIVPDDGETHQGIFDVSFLHTIPGVALYAPACYDELRIHLKQALYDEKGIAAVRYPRGGEGMVPQGYVTDYKPYTLFRAQGANLLLITYGRIFFNALAAVQKLACEGIRISILKLNRVLPLEEDSLRLAMEYSGVVFMEEGSRAGGMGEMLGSRLMESAYRGRYWSYAIEEFVPVCKTDAGLRREGLDAHGMEEAIRRALEDLSGQKEELWRATGSV